MQLEQRSSFIQVASGLISDGVTPSCRKLSAAAPQKMRIMCHNLIDFDAIPLDP